MSTPWRTMSREERLQQTVGRWRALVPALTSALAITLMTFPLFTPMPVLPHAGFLAVAAWTLFQPDLMRPWVAFLLGLLSDAVLGVPLGVNTTLLPALAFALGAIEVRLGPQRFGAEWLLVALAALPFFLLSWQFLEFAGRRDLVFGPLLLQAATTALTYPVAAAACARVQRTLVLR